MTKRASDKKQPNPPEPKPHDPGSAMPEEGGAMPYDPHIPGRHRGHRFKPPVRPH